MVALNGFSGNGLSVVGRVRQLLVDVDGALGGKAAPEAHDRLSRASDQGTARTDLCEIEDRLKRLEGLLPGSGVESGPLLKSVRDLFLSGRQQGGLDERLRGTAALQVFSCCASTPRRLES